MTGPSETTPSVRAAGGVVSRLDGKSGRKFAVVHRSRHDDWSLPKGKLEPDESLEECALREVSEETGFVCTATAYLGTTDYIDNHGRPKTVSWWLMEPDGGRFEPGAEVDELVWLDAGGAGRRLTYERDRELLAKAVLVLG